MEMIHDDSQTVPRLHLFFTPNHQYCTTCRSCIISAYSEKGIIFTQRGTEGRSSPTLKWINEGKDIPKDSFLLGSFKAATES